MHRRASSEADRIVREAIAYHEAGHAVISMKLGYRCVLVGSGLWQRTRRV